MDLNKRRWLVLAASCLINLCIGSLYAWSVFAGPMAERLSALTGRTVADLAIVFTLVNSVGPITMISGGAINDRLGPRWVIILGGLLFGLGMFFPDLPQALPSFWSPTALAWDWEWDWYTAAQSPIQ